MLDRALKKIASLPRIALNPWPTPFMPMDGLRRSLGPDCPRLWVKREDMTSLGAGGNKIRKLEFVVAKAMQEGADILLNTGEVQSNQVVQTAAVAARLGLRCELFLGRTDPPLSEDDEQTGNILLSRLLGARIHLVPPKASRADAMARRAEELKAQGAHPYVIARGATTPEGDAGAILGLLELVDQAKQQGVTPDGIVVTVGSSGTSAGYLVALTLLAQSGGPRIPLYAFDAFGTEYPQQAYDRIMSNAEACWKFLELPGQCGDDLLRLSLDFVGPGYSRPYQGMIDAVRQVASEEGIILDPNYTGKSMAGMLHMIREGRFRPDQNLVYLHSGGLPALFAMRRCFEPLE